MQSPRFAVIPPGPVTDQGRVELRLAVPNLTAEARRVTVRFYLDHADAAHQIAAQTLTLAPNRVGLARAWWTTAGRAGKRRLLFRIEGENRPPIQNPASETQDSGSYPIEVIASKTPALPKLQGAWIESFAALRACQGDTPLETERNLREHVDAMHRLGMNLLIVAYVEYQGTFFYPSQIAFYDRDVKRMARGADCQFDLLEVLLSQADKNGMQVMLGIGRGGDTYLLWEFNKPGWNERNAEAVALGKRVIQELYDRYGHHPSLYGWYFTHEMNDLAKASAYYDPLAEFCQSLAPQMPTLVAPAGTPILDRKTLRASKVDIFAYQDAVGSGYVPYKNTFNPENRIAMLDEIYARYRDWHAETDKHLWADLEIWEMDGKQGYSHPYPPAFSRVRRQIETEAKYVSLLTGYAWFGYMRDPNGRSPAQDPRADRLFTDYQAYLRTLARPSNRRATPLDTSPQ